MAGRLEDKIAIVTGADSSRHAHTRAYRNVCIDNINADTALLSSPPMGELSRIPRTER